MPDVSLPCPRCGSLISADFAGREGPIVCPGCDSRLALQDADPQRPAWYFAGPNQDKIGPFSWVQLRQLAALGKVGPADRLWRSGMADWTTAGALASSSASDRLTPLPRGEKSGGRAATPTCRPSRNPARGPGRSSAAGSGSQPAPNGQGGPAPVFGDFHILKKLGSGGMGVVYLAQQQGADRRIALKVLSKTLASQREYVQRFMREAGVLSRLRHPNVVEFCGAGEANGQPYFAMEFIDGFTLEALLKRRGGRLEIADALYIALAAARGLAYAHERNVIHRDVKPTNIMVNRLGRVKITDLGLAKPVDEDLSLTASGAGVGTPQYMAPEQARNAEQADPRTDVYGLGGVLYHMLTGALPFEGDTVVALMLAKEKGHFPSARQRRREISDRLDLMIDRMLAKDVRLRYPSFAEVIRDIEGLGLAGEHLSFNPLHALDGAPAH